jgi:putative flippase GtrA
VAWIAAVLFAYVTNKLWVFRSYNWEIRFVLREAVLFISARILTGIFEIVSVPLLVKLGLSQTLFGVKGMWAKVLVSVVVMILNYVFSKLIVFRKKE